MRRILSHSAGLTVHGFDGYSSNESIPTLQQILNGEKPANSSAIVVDTLPGLQWRYSGGGFTVVQQLVIDMMNDPFPEIMKRLVLEPSGMSLSTFEQPLPDSRCRETASGHYAEGIIVTGNSHIYPEMAAAGLWTTPTDLANWALEIAEAWNGHTARLLSKPMATQMLAMQKPPSGLGVFLEGNDDAIGFSHGGGNEGFLSELVMFPTEGKGAVIMTNANQGSALIGELFPSIAAEYHWPGRMQSEREAIILETKQYNGIVGTFSQHNVPTPISYEISCRDGRLFIDFKDILMKSEIYAASANEFFSLNGLIIVFTRDSFDNAIKLNIGDSEAFRQHSN